MHRCGDNEDNQAGGFEVTIYGYDFDVGASQRQRRAP